MHFVTKNTQCRFCGDKIKLIKDLGNFSSCGKFLNLESEEVESGVLKLAICPNCNLVQLYDGFNQAFLYTDGYGYHSSLNQSMVSHLSDIAVEIANLAYLKNFTEVRHLDIGSNDATLINLCTKFFKKVQIDSIVQLGIDPSAKPHKLNYINCNLILELFTFELALRLNQKFNVITSIAMLYDLPDPKDFVSGIKRILDPEGVWVSEQSYIFSMIEQNAFDTICHEHLEYYSVTDINNLCNYAGLELFDVSFNTVNGGSFRFFVQHVGGRNKITERLIETLSAEKMRDKILELELMFDRVQYLRNLTNKFLLECRDSGREVHGYGASTKGNTLLQYFGITRKEISCVAEINEKKFGKFTPGTKIPIVSEKESKSQKPYAYLVLPWHFSESILSRESKFMSDTGTKFCFPLPDWRIV